MKHLLLSWVACTLFGIQGCGDPPGQVTDIHETWFKPEHSERGIEFYLDTELSEHYWMPEILVGGGAAIDFNDDGWVDIYLLQATGEGGNRLYQNMGNGMFRDVTEGSGAGDTGYGSGVATGDVDGDGDVDMFITNLGQDVLLVNEGGGRFSDVTLKRGLGDKGWGSSASFFDADGDGDLDLYVCRYALWSPETVLPCRVVDPDGRRTFGYCKPSRYPTTTDLFYLNDGEGYFRSAGDSSGVDSVKGYGLGVAAGDFDMDGDTDLFVANDTTEDRLWINAGNGVFEESGFNWACDRDSSGLAKAGMGVVVVDLNDDGAPDLLVCNIKGEADSLYLNTGTGFRDVTSQAGLSGPSFRHTRFGLGLIDFNNDEQLDYFAANGAVNADPSIIDGDPFAQTNLLLKGRAGQLGFDSIEGAGGLSSLEPRTSRGAIFGDFNNDGGIDILVVNRNEKARLLMNNVVDRGNWLLVDVRNEAGTPALGTRVELDFGERVRTGILRTDSSYLTANDHRVHFGLGRVERVPTVVVTWPDGSVLELEDVEANSILRVDHPGRK